MKHFSIEDFACLSHEFIKKLKLKNPVIIGNCLGGNIAMEMVRMYPRLISRLILVEVYGFFPNVYRLLLAPGLNKLLYRTLFKTRKGFDFLNSYMPLQQTDGNNGWEYTWEGFERTHVDSALKFLKAIYVYAKGTFKARFENYTSDIPAVYVEGGRTFGPAAEFSTMVNKYYSNLEKVSIPESLHNPVVEKPELFSERVLSAMGF